MTVLKKIQAFTIIELVMSLLISSVVISIVFYSYLLLNNQFNRYQQRSALTNDFLLLQKAIQTDFDKCETIKLEGEKTISCDVMGMPNYRQYEFRDSLIIRSAGDQADSFKIKNTIVRIGHVETDNTLSPVSKMMIRVMLDQDQVDVIFTKQYSAAALINQLTTHE
jgi:type II secretory pathway pseudopilin PulG